MSAAIALTDFERHESVKSDQEVREYFAGDDTAPSLMEVRASPHKLAVPHAHDVDEIVYVLAGELCVGRHVYGPESAIYVPAQTLYSFRPGADGVRYLTFRPRHDESYIGPSELVASRRVARSSIDADD